jgi:hypothetical protein
MGDSKDRRSRPLWALGLARALQSGTDVMNRSVVADSTRRRGRPGPGLGHGWALVIGLVMLTTALGLHAIGAPSVQASEQYVFSMGIVDQVGADRLTLRFDDGVTETYTLNGATTIQTQNGDELRVADLEVGEMAIVLTVENDPLAVTIVSGGAAGFHEAGPADIRGHDERECTACDAHAP